MSAGRLPHDRALHTFRGLIVPFSLASPRATVTESDSQGRKPIQDAVSQAERHALAQDEVYAASQRPGERRWTKAALVMAVPVLAVVVLWNVRVMRASLVPPPEIEAVDLARTLRIAVDEVDTFVEESGRLPEAAEAEEFLPEGASLREDGEGYELVMPAPVVDELRYRSVEDPDRWLAAIRSTLDAGGAR